MLKFLRKYQLLVLAVGGSLLMVVFLLEPILTRLAPNPDNKKVAEIERDGRGVTAGDRRMAALDIQDLGSMLPSLPAALGIDPDHPGDHWLLMTHEAEAAGLVGEDLDGASWVNEIVAQQVGAAMRQAQLRGQFVTPSQQEEFAANLRSRLEEARNVISARRRMPLVEVDRMLARARGVARLRDLYAGAARMSDRRLIDAAATQGAAALADAVLVPATLVASTVEDPSDEAMREHLERYGDVMPGDFDDNEFGVGYRLPDRVQIEWLVLDPAVFESVAEVDRVELRKRWQRANPDGTDAAFAEARPALERQLRAEAGAEIMAEADQIVRGEILRLVRPLEEEGPYRVVPSDWPAAGPDYERIAQLVVRQVQERLGVRVPAPRVERRTDRWLNREDIARLPGLGRAAFRIGAQRVAVAEIAGYVREINESEVLRVQRGVPVLDPFATDEAGRHFYVTVLDARAESAPESLDVVIEAVRANMRVLAAYELLTGVAEPARLIAAEAGLEAAVGLVAAEARVSESATLPQPLRDLIVFSGGVQTTMPGQSSPPALNSSGFTEAVLETARGLDPLAPVDSGDPERTTLAVELPRSRSVAFAKVRALRPFTAESYRVGAERLVQTLVSREVGEAFPEDAASPFTLDAMSERLGYTFDYRSDDDDAPGAESAGG